MILFKKESRFLMIFLTVFCQCLACGKSNDSPVNDEDDERPNTEEINVTTFRGSSEDDHEMIQKAIDYASSKRIYKVYIPDGEYMVSAASVTGQPGIILRDNIHLRLASGAVLKAIPNNAGNYNILRIHNVSNVTIEGGTVMGERNEHTGTGGEWGMGIDIRNSSNIEVKKTKIKDCWGDGIYVAAASKNLVFDDIVCDNNRRQGISVINCDGLVIKNSTFKNTNGAAPAAGIDLEPNEGDEASNIQILNCRFENNLGLGLHMYGRYGPVTDVLVEDCVIDSNPVGLSLRYEGISNVHIKNVQIANSKTEGFRIFDGAHSITAQNVVVFQSEKTAIRIADGESVDLTNIVVDQFETGILIDRSKNVKVKKAKLTSRSEVALAMDIKNSEELEFDDFDIDGAKEGLRSTSNSRLKFVNSTVKGLLEYGFYLSNTHHSFIENNTISNNSKIPVYLTESSHNNFSNNTLSDNCFFAHNQYSQFTIEGVSTGNTFSLNNALAISHINKPKHVVKLGSSTSQNIVATNNIFALGSYATGAIKDDTNGQNQID